MDPHTSEFDALVPPYNERGYVVVENLLSDQQIQEAEAEIERVSQQDRTAFRPGDLFFTGDTDVLQQIERLERYSLMFAQLRDHRCILDVVESLLPKPVHCENVSYMAKPARIGAIVPYHQDNAYYHFVPDDALTVWVALDASRTDNGCLRVIPGSHKNGTVPHVSSGVRGISFTVAQPIDSQLDGEVALELSRGDASVHHCNLFHASKPNLSENHRRGLVMFYHSSHCQVDKQLRAGYLEAQEPPQ